MQFLEDAVRTVDIFYCICGAHRHISKSHPETWSSNYVDKVTALWWLILVEEKGTSVMCSGTGTCWLQTMYRNMKIPVKINLQNKIC